MKNKMKNNLAIIVARISSHRQQDGISFDAQEAACRKHATLNGLKVVDVHKLIESAKSSNSRQKFHSIIKMAIAKRIGHIIFYQFDRESRNLTDNEFNEQLVRDGKIWIHYARDNKIFNSETSDSDYFLRDIHAVTNRQFIRTLTAKVNDAMTQKAEDGWFPNNHAPLGYKHEHLKDEDGRVKKRGTIIVPDSDLRAVRLVQREFELRGQNFSLDAIHEKVIREGLLPDKWKRKYSKSAIEKRLKNPFYRGQFRWKGKIYDGKHELIIPVEHLEAVDASFGIKASYGRRLTAERAVLVGGWLRCNFCGCQVIYDPKTKINKKTGVVHQYHYYHCSNGRKMHERQVNVSENKLWAQFESAIDAINIPEAFAKKIAAALNETFEATKEATRKQMEDCRAEMDKLEKKRDFIFDLFAKNEVSREDYEHQSARLKQERESLMIRLEEFQHIINGAQMETARSILELATSAKTLWNQRSPIERRQLLDMLLSNRSLNGATVEYDLKKPFAVLAEMARNQDWRPLGNSNPRLLRERELS